jgi:hypothetical protein
MAQNDLIISNQLFPATRQDINDAFESIATQQSGATEPTTKYAYQTYADTTNGVLKRRNSLNTDYLIRDTLSDTLVDAKTTTYTVVASDFSKFLTLDTTTGDATINLPAASTVGAGFYIDFQKIVNLNEVIIDPDSTETINGQSTYTVYCKDSGGRIICNGSNWNLLLTPGPVLYETDALSADVTRSTTGATNDIMSVNTQTNRKLKVTAVISFKQTSISLLRYQIDTIGTIYFDPELRVNGLVNASNYRESTVTFEGIVDTGLTVPNITVDMILDVASSTGATTYGNGTTQKSFLQVSDISDTHRSGDLDA